MAVISGLHLAFGTGTLLMLFDYFCTLFSMFEGGRLFPSFNFGLDTGNYCVLFANILLSSLFLD